METILARGTVGTSGQVEIGQAVYILVFASSVSSTVSHFDQVDMTWYNGAVQVLWDVWWKEKGLQSPILIRFTTQTK